ncbi:MAG: zf-TFIIB domain-containing protein [Phycisphaerales bacterium]
MRTVGVKIVDVANASLDPEPQPAAEAGSAPASAVASVAGHADVADVAADVAGDDDLADVARARARADAAWRHDRLMEHLERAGGCCPACTYDLRGQAVDRCPECGGGLELRVGVTSLNVHGFVLLLLPFAFSGMCAVLLIGRAVLFAGLGRPPTPTALTLSVFGGLSGLVGLWLAAGSRRWFGRSRRTQWSAILIAWAVHAAAFGGLITYWLA